MYISQVLKRNRTLKVLNLSENKIDVAGLVSIAEALVRHLLHLSMSMNTDLMFPRNTTRRWRPSTCPSIRVVDPHWKE